MSFWPEALGGPPMVDISTSDCNVPPPPEFENARSEKNVNLEEMFPVNTEPISPPRRSSQWIHAPELFQEQEEQRTLDMMATCPGSSAQLQSERFSRRSSVRQAAVAQEALPTTATCPGRRSSLRSQPAAEPRRSPRRSSGRQQQEASATMTTCPGRRCSSLSQRASQSPSAQEVLEELDTDNIEYATSPRTTEGGGALLQIGPGVLKELPVRKVIRRVLAQYTVPPLYEGASPAKVFETVVEVYKP